MHALDGWMDGAFDLGKYFRGLKPKIRGRKNIANGRTRHQYWGQFVSVSGFRFRWPENFGENSELSEK